LPDTPRSHYDFLLKTSKDSSYTGITEQWRTEYFLTKIKGKVLNIGALKNSFTNYVFGKGYELDIVNVDLINWNDKRTNHNYVVADGYMLPFKRKSFDSVLMGETLEHLIDPEVVLEEVIRVLTIHGRLIGSTPCIGRTEKTHVVDFYSKKDLINLLVPYFYSINVIQHSPFWLFECSN